MSRPMFPVNSYVASPNEFLRRAPNGAVITALGGAMPRKLKQFAPGRSIRLPTAEATKDMASERRLSGCEWCLNGERPPSGLCPSCVFKFRRLLQSSRWQRLRLAYLSTHPHCELCKENGILELATDIDHLQPWRFFPDLFWEEANHRALSHQCHSRITGLSSRFNP